MAYRTTCLTGEGFGVLGGLTWGPPSGRWQATFCLPKGWTGAGLRPGQDHAAVLCLRSPEGGEKRLPVDLRRHGYAFEEINPGFLQDRDGTTPEFELAGERPIHAAESTEWGDWHVARVIWRVGGCSGNPPFLMLLVVRDLRTGEWTAELGAFQPPPAPDMGPPLRLALNGKGSLEVSGWDYQGRSTAVWTGWRFERDGLRIRTLELRPSYVLYTRNGRVARRSDSPERARHLGYQEAAWALRAWDAKGGTAEAFAESPRQITCPEEAEGGPLLPSVGTRRFLWAAEIYVVPRRGRPGCRPLGEVLAMLRREPGRWDVVIFPGEKHPLALRLVAHVADMPHSRRPMPPPVGGRGSSGPPGHPRT